MINMSRLVVVCCCLGYVWCSAETVAFTAYLSAEKTDVPIGTTIVYDNVVTNIGNGYDSAKGVFTAPSNGIYVFNVVVETKLKTTKSEKEVIVVHLMVDGEFQVTATAESYVLEQNAQGSTNAVLELTAGQKVWVETFGYESQYFEGTKGYAFNSFTGYRIAYGHDKNRLAQE